MSQLPLFFLLGVKPCQSSRSSPLCDIGLNLTKPDIPETQRTKLEPVSPPGIAERINAQGGQPTFRALLLIRAASLLTVARFHVAPSL